MSVAMAVGEDDAGAATLGLLVLTDEHSRYRLLGQPFQAATVWEQARDATDLAMPAGPFSAIVIDRFHLDLGWLDRVLQAALPSLASGGRVLIALDPEDELAPQPAPAGFAALAWDGLDVVNGRVCAILRPGASTAPVAELLVACHSAVRLANAASADTLQTTLDRARRELGHEIDDRDRSECALLDHLERLASPPASPRRPPRLREFMRRFRVARGAYALLRRLRRNGSVARG